MLEGACAWPASKRGNLVCTAAHRAKRLSAVTFCHWYRSSSPASGPKWGSRREAHAKLWLQVRVDAVDDTLRLGHHLQRHHLPHRADALVGSGGPLPVHLHGMASHPVGSVVTVC